jgi:hypothetical protein
MKTSRLLPDAMALVLTAAALTAAAVPARAEDVSPVKWSGFVELAYAGSNRDADGTIPGNLYLRQRDQFLLNAANLRAERPVPTDSPGGGFVVEIMAGRHAEVIRAAGLDLGAYADVVQAFGTYAWPDLGLQVSAGKMATLLGNEVIETVVNPNLSVGYQYVFLENFTDTGVDVALTRGPWTFRGRVVNGWDVVADNNSSKTVFGKAGWSNGTSGLALLGYTGRELPDTLDGSRSGFELLANTKVGRVSGVVQFDAGREEDLDADWMGFGVWVVVPLREGYDLALRGDWMNDDDGFRSSGALGFPGHSGQSVTSLTATLAIRAMPGMLVRPEIRLDRSDEPVFEGEEQQVTAALGAALVF